MRRCSLYNNSDRSVHCIFVVCTALYCAGYYRWSINAFAYLRNVTAPHKKWVPVFDEPFISMDWARDLAPHRVGLVGESLFVHCQVEDPRTDKRVRACGAHGSEACTSQHAR